MGTVWLGERVSEVGASKLVALKVVHLSPGSKGSDAFLREARVSMSMNHPNIVQVFDAGLDGDRAWLDLEYVEGVDLSKIAGMLRSKGQQISEAAIVHLARSLLRALEHAHGLRNAPDGKGVVHRDVSPQNILVSLHGEVKLSDFGIARVVETIPSATSPMGKARYMAPEQMAGRAGPQSDLFAVGAVLHELLEGRKFRERTPRHAMLRAALDGQVPTISRPMTPALREFVLGLVAVDPLQRFPSAHAALAFMGAHELKAEAAGEWAALSTRASASQRQLPPPGGSEHCLSGEATEHGTGETVADAAAHAPTRTRIEGRRRRWRLPVLIVVSLGVLSVPGYFGWRAWARLRMPSYTFDTGVAACDELLQAFSRYEQSPGQPYHSESALREIEASYNNGAARDPAAQKDICIEIATRMKDEGVYPDW